MALETKESQGIILSGPWLAVLENVARSAKYISHGSISLSSAWCLLSSLSLAVHKSLMRHPSGQTASKATHVPNDLSLLTP